MYLSKLLVFEHNFIHGQNTNTFLVTLIYGGPHLPRQNILFHGKTYFLTAKLTFPRQNLLSHGKTYFSTAKLTFSRQNILFHGKTYFLTAKLTFPRQNILFHGKTYFSTAQLTFPSLASSLSPILKSLVY